MSTVVTRPLDPISVARIQKLHPKLRDDAMKILTDITNTIDTPTSFCRFAFTLRTFEEQQAIYNQGRTTKGSIVTNAKPGQSLHNYGLAVDIAFVINGTESSWDVKADWNKNKEADWMECVAIFKKYGWEWGGSWVSFKDLPHFQKTFGYSWQKLLQLKNAGKVDKDGYVLL
jgi:peptidoglycan LD-endopeptidase CwlK